MGDGSDKAGPRVSGSKHARGLAVRGCANGPSDLDRTVQTEADVRTIQTAQRHRAVQARSNGSAERAARERDWAARSHANGPQAGHARERKVGPERFGPKVKLRF